MVVLGQDPFTYQVSGDDWGKLPEGWGYNDEATAVAVDSHDNLLVFNRGNHPVIVMDREGNVIRAWGEGLFTTPHGVTIGPDDSVYCVDKGQYVLRKFTPEGKELLTIGTPGRPTPVMSGLPFNNPSHAAIDPRNGDIYISDGYSDARVHKYDPSGRPLLSWGESGTDPGQFNVVHNIATDRDGWVYVADRQNKRIQVFDPTGRYEAQWVNFARANCVCTSRTGERLAYVGELFSGVSTNVAGMRIGPRISVLDMDGKVLARLGDQTFGGEPGRFYAPHAIAVDSRGDIYLAETSRSETEGDRYDGLVDSSGGLRSLQKLVKVE